MPKQGNEWHRLQDRDDVARTAHCSKCGPVNTRKKKYVFVCVNSSASTPGDRIGQQLRARERKYGVDITALYNKQKGRCAICKNPINLLGKSTHVDHCHDSGQVRGLLCMPCNIGIGCLKHDAVRLRSAARYLAR